jgi:hypothetical protein
LVSGPRLGNIIDDGLVLPWQGSKIETNKTVDEYILGIWKILVEQRKKALSNELSIEGSTP